MMEVDNAIVVFNVLVQSVHNVFEQSKVMKFSFAGQSAGVDGNYAPTKQVISSHLNAIVSGDVAEVIVWKVLQIVQGEVELTNQFVSIWGPIEEVWVVLLLLFVNIESASGRPEERVQPVASRRSFAAIQ